MKRIAIIPARAGSKRLKNKNVIDLCGKPLLAYSIEAAINSKLFEKIILSTDSEEYARIGQEYGVECIFRDERISDDKATTFMVIEDILTKFSTKLDYFVLLQPTSPLRTENHITEAVNLFEKNLANFHFLVSVKEAEHPNVLVKPIERDLSLKHFCTDFSNYRRQTFEEYSPNGAIYIGKSSEYLNQKHFFGKYSLAYFMDKAASVDIDDEIDLKLASVLMEERQRNG
ncbi:MAG: acylneuraminate cytidylyltransferase family protein [Peptoanaerobacter stomatis]|uniref:acylneuraminate cytidylyltransferase family protein n=1 Tax=Peptoanaerobacter stomatis TaxID=796937 RepID=UPI003FA030D6